MDGSILLMDYSGLEREKIKLVLNNISDFDIVEISESQQFDAYEGELGNFVLVILDIAFPSQEDGFEILQRIRNSPNPGIPVIVVTKLDKPDIRQKAAQYAVKDFIVKPYQFKRLESSIRSLVKITRKFSYDTGGIQDISMTFDEYIARQLKFMERSGLPFSIILITPAATDGEGEEEQELKNKIYSVVYKTASQALRATDDVIMGRDILVLLPGTDADGAEVVRKRIMERSAGELAKMGVKYEDFFDTACVSYPREGDNFQGLMEAAFKKIADKKMLDKIASISLDTRKYANKRYNQFRRWF